MSSFLPASDGVTALSERPAERSEEPFPDHHNDLAATLKFAWQMLGRGVQDRRSAFHTPVMSTNSAAGPQARVLVLRACDVASRLLTFHTDTRSEKMRELALDQRVALTFYDAARKAQVRINGTATLHVDTALSHQRWLDARPSSLRCYLGAQPGAASADPTSGLPAYLEGREPGIAELASAEPRFAVLTVVVQRLEWLHLHTRGQRRADFLWPVMPTQPIDPATASCQMQWLNP